MDILVQCNSSGNLAKIKHLRLEGSGILVNGTLCTIAGPGFTLAATVAGHTTLALSQPELYWPDNPMHLLPPVDMAVVNETISPQLVESIDKLLRTEEAEITDNHLIQHVLDAASQHQNRKTVLSVALPRSCLGVVLCGGILFYLMLKRRHKNKQVVFTIPQGWLPVQNLTVANKENV